MPKHRERDPPTRTVAVVMAAANSEASSQKVAKTMAWLDELCQDEEQRCAVSDDNTRERSSSVEKLTQRMSAESIGSPRGKKRLGNIKSHSSTLPSDESEERETVKNLREIGLGKCYVHCLHHCCITCNS